MMAAPAIATPAPAAARAVYPKAVFSPDGPSGIGLAKTGPKVIASPVLFARALKSRYWTNTPEGMEYRGCFYELPKGTFVDSIHDKFILPSGATQHVSACPYPTIVRSRASVPARHAAADLNPDSQQPAASLNPDSWLISSWWTSPTWLADLYVDYAVPTAPSVYIGQGDFLFSSFENAAGNSIIQPVLGYGLIQGNSGATLGGKYLWILSYYYWSGNVAVLGGPVKVSPADSIESSLIAAGCNTSGTDCDWRITTTDENSGEYSQEDIGSDPAYTIANSGVLETDASGCDQLFANGHGVFRHIAIYNSTGAEVTPSWTIDNEYQCSMTEPTTATSADILYTP